MLLRAAASRTARRRLACPRERRLMSRVSERIPNQFQPTRPRETRPEKGIYVPDPNEVSTHASARDATSSQCRL